MLLDFLVNTMMRQAHNPHENLEGIEAVNCRATTKKKVKDLESKSFSNKMKLS